MKKKTKIILGIVLVVIIVLGITVYALFGNMISMMMGSTEQYDNMADVSIYSTVDEMRPTGITISEDPGTYNLMIVPILNNDSSMLKKATVQAGDGTVYEFLSDEGGMGSTAQQAPNPLSYMIAGSSSNLYSQVIATAIEMDIQIDELTVEQRIAYREDDIMTDHAYGFADIVVTSSIIDSPASEETIAELTEAAMASWEAGEGIANDTPISSYLLVNGQNFTENYATPGATVTDALTDQVVSSSDIQPELQTIEAAEDTKLNLFNLDDLLFDMVSVVSSAGNEDNPYQSTALVRCTIGSYSAWEITSDDASLFGGESTMPTSLHYFTAGTGFCLMTQMSGAIGVVDIDLNDFRVEQQISYDDDETLTVETYVLLDSNDTDEKNEQFFTLSLNMCLAGEELKNATEMENAVYLNGSSVK